MPPASRRTSAASAGTRQQINRLLARWADHQGLERERNITVDATAVESPIRYPLGSQLLTDSKRVLTTLFHRLARDHKIVFRDHEHRAKHPCLQIKNHGGQCHLRANGDLLKVACKTIHYAKMTLRQADHFTDLPGVVIAGRRRHYRD